MGENTVLAARLRARRKARGWTQHDLSQASGLTRSHSSRLERGDIQLPANERLHRLAGALNTSVDDLLEAAGYWAARDDPAARPDLATYLRRKYGLTDPGLVGAVQTILHHLVAPPESGGQAGGNALTGVGMDTPAQRQSKRNKNKIYFINFILIFSLLELAWPP